MAHESVSTTSRWGLTAVDREVDALGFYYVKGSAVLELLYCPQNGVGQVSSTPGLDVVARGVSGVGVLGAAPLCASRRFVAIHGGEDDAHRAETASRFGRPLLMALVARQAFRPHVRHA